MENLALAMGMKDVETQGAFIAALIEPFGENGMMLLDLHNIYCQIHNFALRPEEALKRYATTFKTKFYVSWNFF